jgi:hypothetical protein
VTPGHVAVSEQSGTRLTPCAGLGLLGNQWEGKVI